ncbi:DUF4870 domain-containing protein [Neptunitalea lumnitzerae]|uniref:Orotate phosphoribosyltransferase n=1 Tax=Neptunitalea lumnitzerae TaxID=2965509 RepID=A0ABQ5MLJ3_9FLAO|nr:DUF4870 domain-containing protein [Neptunitalea sp. Y10]GLB50275.1 orotate phosphoribosyltransferase [Neptunitalea sp. Y10]
MDSSITNHHKNVATLIQLSVFSKFIIPLGNFVAPIILWVLNKDRSKFIDENGKQALNFQLSILIYSMILAVLGFSVFAYNNESIWNYIPMIMRHDHFVIDDFGLIQQNLLFGISAIAVVIAYKVFEIVCVVTAAIKAKNGEAYQYPITIKFLK